MKNILINSPSYDRRGKVLEALHQQNAHLEAIYREAKYKKMEVSPYIFYRGTNHLFWADFAGDWLLHRFGGEAGCRTWLQGDAHVYNMGAFLNHHDEVIFGLDDFDDSLVADYQYDVWRFVASMVLDARENGHLSESEITNGLKAFSQSYLTYLVSYDSDNSQKETHYTAENTHSRLSKFLEKTAQKESRHKMLTKWTNAGNSETFRTDIEKLAPVEGEERTELMEALKAYRKTLSGQISSDDDTHFEVKDVARRLWAGTGSLGEPRFYILLAGDESTHFDNVILDVKRQNAPTAYSFLSQEEIDEYNVNFENHAQRQAEAFKALAEHPDNYLGWLKLGNDWFSVRERSPFKGDFPSEKLNTKKKYVKMAKQWGKVLATEHQRAGRHLNAENDPYLFENTIRRLTDERHKEFSELVEQVAFRYADQVTKDWEYFCEHLQS